MKFVYHNIKHFFFYLLSATIVLLAIPSCSKEVTDNIETDGDQENEITLILRIPAPEVPMSRSMSNGEDYVVKQALVLAFAVENAPYKETFAYYCEGKYIASSSENNTYNVTFRAQLKEGNYKLVIVANPGEQLKDLLTLFLNNGTTDKVQILQLMQFVNTEKWNAGDNYTPIPMYAETGIENITTGTTLNVNPSLIRMLSRIDVSVKLDAASEGTFQLEKVHLANYNVKGYVAPKWDNNGITATEITEINLPPNPGENTGIIEYPVSGATSTSAQCIGEIYTFETDKVESYTNDTEFYKSLCLILEGSFNGETNTFYRVDLTNESTGKYMPLLRNNKYEIIVTQANRPGYKSLTEALNSYGVASNGTLRVRTVSYDMGDLTNIVFDGEYLLGTNAKEPVYDFPAESGSRTFIIHTNYPEGFSLTVSDSQGQPVNWLTLSMYQGTGTQTITYNILPNNASARKANITLTAGRLKDTIQIQQAGS